MKKEKNTPARILSQKQVFKRFFSLDIVEAEPRSLRHDGYAARIEREVLRIGELSVILLYCPETDEVLLNQQFRTGAFLAGIENPFMYECAAGLLDEGETPEQTARREALEETGCTVMDIEPAGFACSSPGSSDEKVHFFVGRIQRPEEGIHGLVSEGEEIKTHLLPADKVIEMLRDGTICNGITMLAVYWFARHHDRLRAKWKEN